MERMTGIEPPPRQPADLRRPENPQAAPLPGSPRFPCRTAPRAPSRVRQGGEVLTSRPGAHDPGSGRSAGPRPDRRAQGSGQVAGLHGITRGLPCAYPGSPSVPTVRHNAPEDTMETAYRCEVRRRGERVKSDLVERGSEGGEVTIRVARPGSRGVFPACRAQGLPGLAQVERSGWLKDGEASLNKHLNRTFRKFRSVQFLLETILVRAQQEMAGIGHTDGGESSGGSYADLGSGGCCDRSREGPGKLHL